MISIEVLSGGSLNISRGQCFDLGPEVVDKVLIQTKGVDRIDAPGKSQLTGQLDGEVARAVFLGGVQLLVRNRQYSHPVKFIKYFQQCWTSHFITHKRARLKRAC